MHYTIHNINVAAVLIAGVASFFIGGIWYMALFTNTWMKALGKTKEDMQKNSQQMRMTAMGTSFVQAVIVAMAMAHIFNLANGWLTIGVAIETVLICWFAFVFMIALVQRNYEQSNITLFYLTVGYRFFEFLAIGLIVFYIR